MPAAQPSSPDPAQSAKLFAEVAERSGRLMGEFLQRRAASRAGDSFDEFGVVRAFTDLTARMLAEPWKLAEMQTKMFWDYVALWQAIALRMLGGTNPVAEPAKGDNRFRDADWQDLFLFDYLKQSYLIAARHLQQTVASVDGLSEETRKKVAFYTRQYVDALSPSNFALTNPLVLRETVQSGGQNLLRGLNNLLGDIERGGISMTDEKEFKVGVNVATAPGKVVFQTDLMQLIQYAPSTETVFRQPLLVIPPWINKYYVLDLREKNSFVRWALAEGHTVFVVSWVNPGERHSGKTFEDYMFEGPLAALGAIERATGESRINLVGYCLGGTLLGATLAWMAASGDTRAASATFLASLLDFSIPGELGVFIDEAQVENLERRMGERGYLEGSEMGATFYMLRPNDLVWSFRVHNYPLGRDPFPFDLLYWNSDSTRMPAKMHGFLPEEHVPREPAEGIGRHRARRRAHRPAPDRSSRVLRLSGRGPYRSLEVHLPRRAPAVGPDAVRARRIGTHRRHHQSALLGQVRLLDERGIARIRGGVAVAGLAARRLVVERLERLDRPPERFRSRSGPRPGRRRAARHRGCPRLVCEPQVARAFLNRRR
jgi:polyhydroxyalkanoate synthase